MAGARGGEAAPLLVRHREDAQHVKDFVRVMMILGASEKGAQILLQKYQIEQFLKGMVEVRAAMEAKRRLRGQTGPLASFPDVYTVENMATFQTYPVGTSLLRIDGILQPHAIRMFQDILRYMGIEDGKFLSRPEEVAIVQRMHGLLQRHPSLRDEACAQLQKQTCDNPYVGGCMKAWELMRVIVAAFPPSHVFAGPLSEYFLAETQDEEAPTIIHQSVLWVWGVLDRALKVGPRKCLPTAEEIDFFLERQSLGTAVFMYDDASEPLSYDMTTTVGDAITTVLGAIKLRSCNSFGLVEVRPIKQPAEEFKKPSDTKEQLFEHLKLDPSRFIGDIFVESRAAGGRGFSACKLLLKKRIFRFVDDVIIEPMFIHLSYIQVRHDYLADLYPVPDATAVELAALQITAELGLWSADNDSTDYSRELKDSLSPLQLASKPFEEWHALTMTAYSKLESMTKDDAKLRALRIILELPHGGAIFFNICRDIDPPKILMNRVTLAVNRRGLRFLEPVSNKVLHAVELKDIEEYAGNQERLYISMLVKGQMFGFEFVTTEGEEICTLLDTHIADALRLKGSSTPETPPKAAPAYSEVGSPQEMGSPGNAGVSEDEGSLVGKGEGAARGVKGLPPKAGVGRSTETGTNGAVLRDSKQAAVAGSPVPGQANGVHANGPASPKDKKFGTFPGPMSSPTSATAPSRRANTPTTSEDNGKPVAPRWSPTKTPPRAANGEARSEIRGAGVLARPGGGAISPHLPAHREGNRSGAGGLSFIGRSRSGGSPLPRSKLGFVDPLPSKDEHPRGEDTKEVEMAPK